MRKPKLALAMIVKPDDREAELLDRCLSGYGGIPEELGKVDLSYTSGIAQFVDAIYITITGENAKCEEVAKKYGAIVSHTKWENDFAKARNFSFSQVPAEYDYIVWCDCDDTWLHPENLHTLVANMEEKAVDVVFMDYLYHFDKSGVCDTRHRKTRIVKNDGGIKWAALYLHEDFTAERQFTSMYTKDVAVYHLSDDNHTRVSMDRNVEIAELAAKDFPKDPRAYWNLANAYNVVGRHAESIPIYITFIGLSNSEDERYLAWHRLAMEYKDTGDLDRAISCEQEAMSLRPWFPDAYHGMGELMLKAGRYRHAKEFVEMGLTKPAPDNEIIVWNPREYDYNPHKLLAQIYVSLAKPREAIKELKKCLKVIPGDDKVRALIKKLEPTAKQFDIVSKIYERAQHMTDKEEIKKLLASVPEEMRYHPAILNIRNVHFTKEESSGKDVVFYCGFTETEWTPATFAGKGVGGSEEAVVQLVKRWAKMGYNVTVYANTTGQQEYEFDGVKWKPFMAWNYRDKQDVTILWRHPKPVDYEINSTVVLVDMHDVVPTAEFTPKRIEKISKVMFKSEAHQKHCENIPVEKTVVIPHGLDNTQFEDRRSIVERNPYKVLNTSSPDRGLLTTIEIVKRVYNKLPEDIKSKLRFRWNYGFRVWDQVFENDDAMMKWKQSAIEGLEELKALGILEYGSGDMISQDAIVDQYLEAGLMLYPSEFFEIGFISGTKAALAGAIPVTTDIFAQGEFLKDGILVHSDITNKNWHRDIRDGSDFGVQTEEQKEQFVDKIVEYMKHPGTYEEQRIKLINHARSRFDWDKTAEAWTKLF